ncbi:MAG: thioesterase family protein [Brachymonas sp.]
MAGLLRNFIALIIGLFSYRRYRADQTTTMSLWATPWDVGWRVVKSDKYLQFAETAQIDYLLKTGVFFSLLSQGIGFVNLAQTVKFFKPVAVFSRMNVSTQLFYADEKSAYFLHQVFASKELAAEVLVKMKFKQGRMTVAPSNILPVTFANQPARIKVLSELLDSF